jgi:hypothetical protein
MRQRVGNREQTSGNPAVTFCRARRRSSNATFLATVLLIRERGRSVNLHERRSPRDPREARGRTVDAHTATFSLRRSNAMIEGHRLSQARRQELETSRIGAANVDSRPIIGPANATPTNSIELCRCRRARLGAHHFKGYSACRYRAGAHDFTVAHRSPQRGIPSRCAGETKAAIALGVSAAAFTLINS